MMTGHVTASGNTNGIVNGSNHAGQHEVGAGGGKMRAGNFRDPATAPLRKLSMDLIKTYKGINEVNLYDA